MNGTIGRLQSAPPLRFASAALCLFLPAIAGAQTTSAASSADTCAALMHLNLTEAEGGPARVTSARIVGVPDGVRRKESYPSGYSDGTSYQTSKVVRYCDGVRRGSRN